MNLLLNGTTTLVTVNASRLLSASSPKSSAINHATACAQNTCRVPLALNGTRSVANASAAVRLTASTTCILTGKRVNASAGGPWSATKTLYGTKKHARVSANPNIAFVAFTGITSSAIVSATSH